MVDKDHAEDRQPAKSVKRQQPRRARRRLGRRQGWLDHGNAQGANGSVRMANNPSIQLIFGAERNVGAGALFRRRGAG
jgi:hypothetical protein